MPKPLTITKEMKQKALDEFRETLVSGGITAGKLKFIKDFGCEADNAIVWLTLEAYRKIVTLVTEFDSEVAWHGIVTRLENDEFLIEDILVYPQVVTGSTVNTDQSEYTKWLYAHDDEVFNKIRMQGHSHCSMGVAPSGVDVKHRQQIVEQLTGESFYIFMIWNKSLDSHTLIYDMKRNLFFDNDEIDIEIRGDESMAEFLADAKSKIQEPSYKPNIERFSSVTQLALKTGATRDKAKKRKS